MKKISVGSFLCMVLFVLLAPSFSFAQSSASSTVSTSTLATPEFASSVVYLNVNPPKMQFSLKPVLGATSYNIHLLDTTVRPAGAADCTYNLNKGNGGDICSNGTKNLSFSRNLAVNHSYKFIAYAYSAKLGLSLPFEKDFSTNIFTPVSSVSVDNTAYYLGDSVRIGWKSNSLSSYKIELLKSEKAVKTIYTNVYGQEGSIVKDGLAGGVNYSLPLNLAPSKDYSVKVTNRLFPLNDFATSSPFEIKKQVISFATSSPFVIPGQLASFNWKNTGVIKSYSVKVVSDATGKTVSSKTVSTNNYIWKTTTKTAKGSYKFIVADHSDSSNLVSMPFSVGTSTMATSTL